MHYQLSNEIMLSNIHESSDITKRRPALKVAHLKANLIARSCWEPLGYLAIGLLSPRNSDLKLSKDGAILCCAAICELCKMHKMCITAAPNSERLYVLRLWIS